MIEAGQTWEREMDGCKELFAVLQVVVKGATDASASVGYCKLLHLDGEHAGVVFWEWEHKLAMEVRWKRFA